ncbi:MAG TPA: hypothetical protein VLC10_03870, partial [Patescibacteria group bacterium]|nr:hypothetical protein [Patescibacteria group bacterium]
AVASRLPPEDDERRIESERVLAQAFTLLLHLPSLTREQADVALDHSTDAETLTAEELAYVCHDPDKSELYEIWREAWSGEDDPGTRRFARYCVALIARLYRMEHFAKLESLHEGQALSARSA